MITMRMMPSLFLFAAIFAAGAGALAAEWRGIGPGGGGAQFRPTLSGLDRRLVVVGTDMNAGFVSEDQGESWRRFHLRSHLQTVLFDPVDRDAIYVLMPGDLGFYRSPDRGRTWHLVYPPASAVARVAHIDDEAEARLVLRGAAGAWPPIRAVTAAARGVFYAVRGSNLEASEDGGGRWRKLAAVAAPPIRGTGQGLFALGEEALAVVEADTVEFWDFAAASPPSTAVQALRASAPPGVTRIVEATAGAGSLYVLTAEPAGLWVTRDRGRRWVNLSAGLTALSFRGKTLAELRGLAAPARNAHHLYVSYSGLPAMLDTLFGVARSTDGGATWKLVWQDGQRRADPRVQDNWLNAAFGPTWGENPLELGVHPDDPELVFGTDYGRTLRSIDGGAHWQGVYSRRVTPGGGWTTRGLDVTTSYGVHFDPLDARRMFISYTDIGLFRSEDSGVSWMAASSGMPNEWRNTTYWMEMDPAVRGRHWAATSNIHDLPRMKMVRRWRPEEKKWHGGVCATRDGGRTWTRSNQGLPDAPVTHVLLDAARSRPGARTLYAAVFGAGVYKSVDDGVTWSAQNTGIASGSLPLVWRLAMDRDGVLYAVVTRRRESLEFGDAATDGAVYRSRDGAARWERVALPAGLNGPHGIAVDPGDPRRLYLAAFGRFEPDSLETPKQGGVFLSEDAGRTWRNVLGEDQYVYDVTVDARRPAVLFATGFQSSLWRSGDRGLHWERVPGFNVKNAHRAIPDPRAKPGMVFVTSYGSSVWYGSELGDPGAEEDIVSPVIGYGRPRSSGNGRRPAR